MKAKNIIQRKREKAVRRSSRVRARLCGTAEQPRLSVKRSLKHLNAQMIDDVAGRTLAAASDFDIKTKGTKLEIAKEVGKLLAERAKEKKITLAIFDRGGYRYHGLVAALADGAREGGLNF